MRCDHFTCPGGYCTRVIFVETGDPRLAQPDRIGWGEAIYRAKS